MREKIIRGLFAFVVLGLDSSVLHPREDAMDRSRWKKLIDWMMIRVVGG